MFSTVTIHGRSSTCTRHGSSRKVNSVIADSHGNADLAEDADYAVGSSASRAPLHRESCCFVNGTPSASGARQLPEAAHKEPSSGLVPMRPFALLGINSVICGISAQSASPRLSRHEGLPGA